MALNREQMDVFGMAVEALECNGSKAMAHDEATRVQSSSRPGQRPVIEWAVDYVNCLPSQLDLKLLVILAHLPIKYEWSRYDIRRCGGAMRGFYSRVQSRGLYGEGLRHLRRNGTSN